MKQRSNKGQAIVEFAFVLPLLCIIVLGIIEFGILFYDKAVITNASREGARAGMVFTTDSDGNYWDATTMQAAAQQAVNDYVQARLITFSGSPTVTTTATRNNQSPEYDYYAYQSGNEGTVEVQVTYQHTYLALPNFAGWGDTITLSAETTMRLE